MPHSLRVKLKGLNYKKILTDRELERLCKALDNEKVLDDIRAEIQSYVDMLKMCNASPSIEYILKIIDKYTEGAKDGNND